MPTTRPAATPGPALPSPEDDEPVPLSRVAVGAPRVVVSVQGPSRDDLEHEGFLPGSVVAVRARTPLGGPLVVTMGRVRVALSADAAACVATRPAAVPRRDPVA